MTTECVHWWKIEMPNGPTSIGVCQYCGREKEYQNFPYYQYNNEPLNDPHTTRLGRKLKRNWDEPLEWKESVWEG